MSFLAPLFLLGAAAVTLPILFHLIRRTSREKTRFSSLMFLQPLPPRVTRRSRLENLLLLALRCLVLGLLALGFARPFLQKPMAADAGAGAGRRIVVLVDASASMRRDTLWADARAKLGDALRDTTPADTVAVLAFDRQVRPVMTFDEWSALAAGERVAVARKRLEEISPSWAGTHLGKALLAAVETLEDPGSRNSANDATTARRIVVITDLQQGSHLEGLQGFEWPRTVEVAIEALPVRRRTNAGMQVLAEQDENSATPADAGPRVRVSNSTDASREQFQVGWAAPGASAFVGKPVEAYVPPDQFRVVALPKPPEGFAAERLRLAGDDDDFDNTAWVVPPKADQIKVLFLGNDTPTNTTQSLFYLQRALQETRRLNVQLLARGDTANVTPSDLAEPTFAVIADPLPETRVAAVREFLGRGKTVLLTLKSAAMANTLARLAGLDSLAAEEASAGRYSMLGRIEFTHPLFAPFADPRYSDFTKIHFWKYRRLETNRLAGARVLASFERGDPALLELSVGSGTLLVLTTSWQPVDSQLALSSKFVPLIYSMLEQSGGLKAQLAQYVVGDDVTLPPHSTAPAQVRKPDGAIVAVAPEATRFAALDLPGVYVFASQQATQRFAVNLDAAESRTAPLPLEELERLGLPLKPRPIADAHKQEEKRRILHATELENRQKLWRWLLLAALAVLLLETWLAGWVGRRPAVAAT